MSKNEEMAKRILNFKRNMQNNVKMLSINIKLASNQKDDAQKVKNYIYDRINYKRK